MKLQLWEAFYSFCATFFLTCSLGVLSVLCALKMRKSLNSKGGRRAGEDLLKETHWLVEKSLNLKSRIGRDGVEKGSDWEGRWDRWSAKWLQSSPGRGGANHMRPAPRTNTEIERLNTNTNTCTQGGWIVRQEKWLQSSEEWASHQWLRASETFDREEGNRWGRKEIELSFHTSGFKTKKKR